MNVSDIARAFAGRPSRDAEERLAAGAARERRLESELATARATLRVAALSRAEDLGRVRLYRRLVAELPVGVALMRVDEPRDFKSWRIVEINRAGQRLTGAQRSERGKTLFDFAPELFSGDFPRVCLEAVLSGRARDVPDFVSRERVPGAHFSISVVPLGGPLAALVFEDTTAREARRRVEQALVERTAALARSNADLTQFAYVASHDLQEPLRKTIAFADQLRSRLAAKMDETDADFMSRLVRAVEGMQSLIDALLKLARVSSAPAARERVDMSAAAREVVDALAVAVSESGGKVDVEALPALDADPQQMRQLLQNLIANALKFRRPGRPPAVRVHGRRLGDGSCEFCVADDGVGFDMKYAARLFQPFQRLHSRKDFAGTGMGLAICQKIAERHGGKISVDSAVDRGTTVRVVLPGAARGVDAPAAAAAEGAG